MGSRCSVSPLYSQSDEGGIRTAPCPHARCRIEWRSLTGWKPARVPAPARPALLSFRCNATGIPSGKLTMDYDVIITNGLILGAEGEQRGDVAIRGETIAAVGPG